MMFIDYHKSGTKPRDNDLFSWSSIISKQVIDSPQKAEMALDFPNIRFGWESYWVLKGFGQVLGSRTLASPESQKYVHSGYSVLAHADASLDDVLVKDFPLVELENAVLDEALIHRTMKFPLNSVAYREFLQGITAGQFKRLCGMIGKDVDVETAIRLSTKILESHVQQDSDEVALDLVEFLDSRVIDKAFCRETTRLVFQNSERFEARLLLREFFGNNEGIFDNVGEVAKIIDLFLNPKITKLWAGNPRNSNLVVWLLSMRLPFEKIRALLETASNGDEKFSLRLWLGIAESDNIEQFVDTPSSWWSSLV